MGYYDDHVTQKRTRKEKSFGKVVFAAVTGGVVGALGIVAMLPVLLDWGFYMDNNEAGTSETAPMSVETNSVVQTDQVEYEKIQTNITNAVENVSEAVVGVVNIQRGGNSLFDPRGGQGDQEAGTGSGVVYKKENGKAYIVTNAHVIDGASKVEVSLVDGTRVEAEVVGSDALTDLAVLTVDDANIKQVAKFGDSDAITLGEPVIAIGNPLGLEFFGSVTQGIISGKERIIPVDIDQNGQPDWEADVIQTDAAINPGNSGGALVNLRGEVIGINSMKIAQSRVEGIGFAIPIRAVQPIIEDLEKHKEVQRPFMGVGLASLSDVPLEAQRSTLKLSEDVKSGIVVTGVEPTSPADKAGLKQYDVIVKLDDQEIKDALGLRKFLYSQKNIGDTMKVTYYRDGKLEETEMKLVKQMF
ncbi:serine protease [Sutcliffiella horikoshii]|uniref:PDZ domain-containing protein n=1 Tax=Sutcliffiella horikoshii TaxID=79883 RepID=A0A1Y0CJ41_9BACI|nr:trypsin-like peptidase domain-containing protein [Sutcliffiella horikoshii]ART75308.1 serine protease [Sutcliffiella horikoshii]TYS58683.1 PDZ domain-containing protein [Sutcliffiella horikoshii]